MEKPESAKGENQDRMEAFRKEIAALRDGESAAGTAHFADPAFDPADLAEDDLYAWEHLKRGTITRDYLKFYMDQFTGSEPPARKLFRGFLANRAGAAIMEKDSEKRRGEGDLRRV